MQKNRLLMAALLALSSASAFAALPTDASTALSTVTTFGSDLLTALWPAIGAISGGFVLIKLFKRGINKI